MAVMCFGCNQLVSILDHRCPSNQKNLIASLPAAPAISPKESTKPPAVNSYVAARIRNNKKS